MNSSDGHTFEDILLNGDREQNNGAITNLQDDDVQCGVIFYNETTRILKFFCTYCEKVSDNINYFCQHLSEHINEHDGEAICEEFSSDLPQSDGNSARCGYEDCDGDNISTSSKMLAYEENTNVSLLPCDLAGFDEAKMVVEELDEAEEIAAEVEAEMWQELEENDGMIPKEENTCSNEFYEYEVAGKLDKDAKDIGNTLHTDNVDVQAHLGEAIRKKKRITTVKVIALKNRVAELYERIKYEEERRSRHYDTENTKILNVNHVPNAEIGVDGIIDNQNEASASTNGAAEPKRHIIGETVITLLPETQSKSFDITRYAGTPHKITGLNKNMGECLDDKTTCPACGRKFRSAFSLTIHKRTHYLESDSRVKLAHKCSDCDQLFNKIPDLKEHIQEVHYPDGFICKICNRRLTSLTLLETHMRKIHLSRPFNCEICRKNFDTRDRFEEHVKAHVSGQPYRCHICGRKYSTECILKQHLHRHKEQIPQCCVVCGKLTLRITQHMKIHAPRPKKVLTCKACGKIFNFSSGLSHHYKVMHKSPKPTAKSKRDRTIDLPLINDEPINSDEVMPPSEETVVEYDSELNENTAEIHQKEEEAKRVIVELIQNATYTSFLPENFHNSMDCGPPIAREETISAVNSIVNDQSS
ncbi:uncharacterized protein [Eurosta solidaginis]|uniref:uncharacterized protein n=1 Tax=Eurosta solidaginis TaxID=178769 RepID=UPI0035307882